MSIESNYTVCSHCGADTYAPDDLNDPLCEECEADENEMLEESWAVEDTFVQSGLVESKQ